MDLNTITSVRMARDRTDLTPFRDGDSFVAGGTWLYSEPQRHLRRLIDLSGLDWTPLEPGPQGLRIAATCTIADLDAFQAPRDWVAAPLIRQCCRAFLASFKIWNVATVGGNLCMGLPAGPMISLCTALDGECLIWTPDGGERRMPVAQFVRGPIDNALEPGEVLRAIDLPRSALVSRTAFRKISLTPLGRSGALLIGALDPGGALRLTVTASTRRPVVLGFPVLPELDVIAARISREITPELYYDDIHGDPGWRRHMTLVFAEEIRAELAGPLS